MIKGMIGKLKKLNGSIQSVGGAALIIAAAGVASRLFGFLRDRILAAQFGAGDVLDAYYAAFRIPDFMYGLLVLGALSAAFVPVFTELYVEKKEEEAWRLSLGVLHLLVFALGFSAILFALFAPALMEALVPGFSPEKKELAARMTRVMLLSPIFLGISAVLGGVLVSLKRFLLYSIAPIFYNLGIIFGALVLVPKMGIAGLSWGVVLGAMAHALIQYVDIRPAGFRYRFSVRDFWKNDAVTKVIRLMVPRSIGMAVNQVGFFVITVFASTLASGSLAAFTLANNIQSVPLGLFGIAFSLAVFPTLSALAARRSEDEFIPIFSKTLRRILFFVLPLSVFIVVLRAQIVRVILGSGEFDWNDTITTFSVLGILSVSLFAQSLIPLFARAFFALQDTKTPLYAALASEAVHIGLTFFLINRFQVEGMAWAFSIATVVNLVLLYWFLRRRFAEWSDRSLLVSSGKIFAASIAAGVVAQSVKSLFGFHEARLDTFVEIFVQFAITLVTGGATFVLLSWIMRVEELEHLKRFFVRRIVGQPQTIVESEDQADRGGV
jgi:putative peptidoglycan lipid II flippase